MGVNSDKELKLKEAYESIKLMIKQINSKEDLTKKVYLITTN